MQRKDPNLPNDSPLIGRMNRTEAIGESDAFLAFQERLSRVARVDRPVLLVGERGTGKELAARKLHYLSTRWQGPMVALNCAALSPSLIESELFGYEAGAFTGAVRRREGRFAVADGGTLLLDEIADIPMEVQEKILRVVEYGTFERVGSSQPVTVDVRIIGATNKDLPALVRSAAFKQDLLDRLSFEVLFLPPLRERKGDIPLLVNHFAARMALQLGIKEVPEFSEDAIAALENHAWPGNVRELKNVTERAVYLADGSRITHIVFNPFISPYKTESIQEEETAEPDTKSKKSVGKTYHQAIKQLQIHLMKQALAEARYNQRKAAQILGLTYHQFRGVYRKLGKELRGP